ncbi:DUF6471 domain-containing protein [Undibacterium luofuense]|nr:DUF6471 domain-containing protein [Undibacterium luofuense]
MGINESPDQINRKVNRRRFSAALLGLPARHGCGHHTD